MRLIDALAKGLPTQAPAQTDVTYQAPVVRAGAGLTTTGIRDLCPDVTWMAPYPPASLTPQEARLVDALKAEQAKDVYPGGLDQRYYLKMMGRLRARALRPALGWTFWTGVGLAGAGVAVLLYKAK